MKRYLITACSCTLFLLGQALCGQEGKIKRAGSDFEDFAYPDAIASYEELVAAGHVDASIYKKLGDANYYNANYAAAADWYAKMVTEAGADLKADAIYQYAQTLKSTGNYKESDQWMLKFAAMAKDDARAALFVKSKNYLEAIKKQSGRIIIRNLSLNSADSDFAPSFYKDGLVFSSSRDSGLISRNIHVWNKRPFADLYNAKESNEGDFSAICKLSKKLNTKVHESSTAFSQDGKTLYFTRNNAKRRSFSRDAEGVSRLKLYRANLVDGHWTNITELPFNSDDYSVAHPALSPDGKQLYFASDMPGTMGQSDIWVVDIKEDGGFGTPKNMGPSINTEARETFPFVTQDNQLYFSSDGHPGLGGLDVFATKLQGTQRGQVINIGEPVNSKEDDFSFILDSRNGQGFFASNRAGGIGSDDIYGFKETAPLSFNCDATIRVVVKDAQTKENLEQAQVHILDVKDNTFAQDQTTTTGSVILPLNCATGTLRIQANLAGYTQEWVEIDLDAGVKETYEVLLQKTAAQIAAEAKAARAIAPIYFDYDQSSIRLDAENSIAKVLLLMRENPSLKLTIGSHTDARASKAYNLRLSQARARATKKYFVAQGIAADRISAEGYGESQLVNDCDDNTPCTEAQHQQNRRSEFQLKE